jgi:hypothetical protein
MVTRARARGQVGGKELLPEGLRPPPGETDYLKGYPVLTEDGRFTAIVVEVLDVEEADILQHFDKCGQFIARVRTRCSFRSTALFC